MADGSIITPIQLAERRDRFTLLDVRKPIAREQSGLTIPGALERSVFDMALWWQSMDFRPVVLFCVHGHEISRAGCGYLRDHGVAAFRLEGGFEAWRAAGLPVERRGARSA